MYKCKIFKVPHTFTDKKGVERTLYTLYLVFENGNVEVIKPNEYTNKKGNRVSNYDVLSALATLVADKNDIKYE